MLKLIHIDTNTEFEIPRDTRIPFNFFNPIFEEQGSTSYSAKMSARSAINRRLTNNFQRIGKPDNSGAYIPVWLEIGGQRKKCTMRILEADKNNIKYNLLFDEGSFIKQFGDTPLNEIDYGIGVISSGELPDWTDPLYTKEYPEVKVAFPPIYNDQYFDGTPYEVNYKADSNFLNRPNSLKVLPKLFGVYPLAPTPYLNHILDVLFSNSGNKLTENFLAAGTLNQLILLNNVDNAVVDIEMQNDLSIDNIESYSFYIIKNHVPSKTIKSFLKSLRNKFNVIPIIDETNGYVRLLNLDELLKKPAEIDLSKYTTPYQLSEIPTYTGYEFLISGEKTPAFDALAVDLKEIDGKLILPEVTRDDLEDGFFKLNGVYRTIDSAADFFGPSYYQLIVDPENPDFGHYIWQKLGYSDLGNIYFGSDENRIKFETEMGLTFTENVEINSTIYEMPSYQAQGMSEHIEFNPDKNFGLILAFYLPPTGPLTAPLANYFDARDSIDLNFSLITGTNNGIIKKFFEKTTDFYLNKGRIYKCKLQLPTAQLLSFDWAEKYNIHGGKFMVKNIKGDFTMKGVDYKSAEIIET